MHTYKNNVFDIGLDLNYLFSDLPAQMNTEHSMVGMVTDKILYKAILQTTRGDRQMLQDGPIDTNYQRGLSNAVGWIDRHKLPEGFV